MDSPSARAPQEAGARNNFHPGYGHHADVAQTEKQIEKILHHNPHDFAHVFHELNHLRHSDPNHFKKNLKTVNEDLHKRGYLPHLQIVEDDRMGSDKKVHKGYDVVADDPSLKSQPGNHTVVSTSHHAPRESEALRKAYHGMHYGRGHYNGWNQSTEGSGGADGGFNDKAVGGHVPEGARKELIDKALQLAGLPQTPQYEAAVNKIVTRESGWNPNITNNWDINAQRGHPSTGLMQTIPSTFKANALKGLDNNIHDPLSNLVAGIRYAEHQYHNRGGLLYVASRPGGY